MCGVNAVHGGMLPNGRLSPLQSWHYATAGVAYMELVGYNSPAVKAKVTTGRQGR